MILIIQFGSRKTPKIKECIEAWGEKTEVVDWTSPLVKPENLKGIIFSGSPTFFTEVDHQPYHERITPLLSWGVPILGICFGHQLMGILHGANIFRGKNVEANVKIKLIQSDILFEGFPNEFEMGEDHSEGIDVPKDFFHLACSDDFPNEAMKHRTKDFWGVQFHPEISAELGLRLFRNFVGVCNKH